MLQVRSRFVRALPGIVLSAALSSSLAAAKEDGRLVSGRSLPNSPGCGGGACHGDASNGITVTIAGPAKVEKGSSTRYTVTVKGTGSAAGVNIRASAGELTLEEGDDALQRVGTELAHTAPQEADGGEYVFAFKLLAPAQDEAIVLSAAGNLANGDSTNLGDSWNFAQPLNVAAGTPTDGSDGDAVKEGCSVAGSLSLGAVLLALFAMALRPRPAYQRKKSSR